MGPVLYSTNVLLKLLIQEQFFGDMHYVWCSECFDSSKEYAYSGRALVGSTSNPADIYRELRRAVETSDQHCLKIKEQKASLSALAVRAAGSGDISTQSKEDIVHMVETAAMGHWRPVIYVIPANASVRKKAQEVPRRKCASAGPEYIIPDLRRSAFDVIEV